MSLFVGLPSIATNVISGLCLVANKIRLIFKLNTMSKSTKTTSNESKNGNKSKPLSCVVAVICPRYVDYIMFVRENKSEINKFIWIDNLEKAKGYYFDKIEKLHRYYEIKNIHKILKYVEMHLSKNLT